MFAVRKEILDALLNDAEWCKRLDKAETSKDVENVLIEFARSKGWKIKEVQIH